jgi:hypothetical protein
MAKPFPVVKSVFKRFFTATPHAYAQQSAFYGDHALIETRVKEKREIDAFPFLIRSWTKFRRAEFTSGAAPELPKQRL